MPIIISPNKLIYPNLINPFVYTVDMDDIHEAIKQYAKLNKYFDITELIATDQQKHWKAKLNYYLEDGRNKVGINYYPATLFGPYLSTNEYYTPPPRVSNPVLVNTIGLPIMKFIP